MNTVAQIAQSYGLKPGDLSALVGIDGVDLHQELSDGQSELIIGLIDNSDLFTTGCTGRHRF